MNTLPAFALATCISLLPTRALASDVGGWTSFRCPTTGRLVQLGASPYQVISQCRAPEERLSSTTLRTVRRTVSATEWRTIDALSRVPITTRNPGDIVAYRALEPAPPTEEPRTRRPARRGVEVARTWTVEETRVVSVERWTFDFGSNRFLRKLVFEDGALVSIVDGDKGVLAAQ